MPPISTELRQIYRELMRYTNPREMVSTATEILEPYRSSNEYNSFMQQMMDAAQAGIDKLRLFFTDYILNSAKMKVAESKESAIASLLNEDVDDIVTLNFDQRELKELVESFGYIVEMQ